MTVPLIERAVLELPGDVAARPHANCYWLVSGRILAGEHPGVRSATAVAANIDVLLDFGIRQFIDLTEEGERVSPYVNVLRERAAARGIAATHSRFPVRDFGVPTAAAMRATLDAIHGAMEASAPVYLHCWAGIGRTGTVVGCLLREWGLNPQEALDLLDRKWDAMEKRDRHPRTPEWPEQFAFIEQWPGGSGRGAE